MGKDSREKNVGHDGDRRKLIRIHARKIHHGTNPRTYAADRKVQGREICTQPLSF